MARHARRACPDSPRSILVLKPSSFGDIIHTLPAVARLKDRWPESRISWLVNPEWLPLLRGNPLVDEVILFPRKRFRGLAGWSRLPSWVREHIVRIRPDLALDYQGLLRTALIGRFARSKCFAGLADAREGARWLYDRAVRVPAGTPHAVERYLALSDSITGSPAAAGVSRAIRFPLPEGSPLDSAWRIGDRYILLHPYSRGMKKSLTLAQVRSICAELSAIQVIVVGNSSNSDVALPVNALNLLNKTSLPQLLTLVRHASFVISVDSGPVHLAAALGRPLVAIHTWSDPRRVGPYLPTAWVLKSGELIQVADLPSYGEAFYRRPPGDVLPERQFNTICRLAISSSNSSA